MQEEEKEGEAARAARGTNEVDAKTLLTSVASHLSGIPMPQRTKRHPRIRKPSWIRAYKCESLDLVDNYDLCSAQVSEIYHLRAERAPVHIGRSISKEAPERKCGTTPSSGGKSRCGVKVLILLLLIGTEGGSGSSNR